MSSPKTGRTALAHVEEMLASAESTIANARQQVKRTQRPAERIHLWRELAGVVSACESVRIWLDMGAPK